MSTRFPLSARAGRVPWWLAVSGLALAARLFYRFSADEPLLFAHPYNYFYGALRILDHPDPLRFILTSDAWHQWLGPWTIAPLYYLFVAGVWTSALSPPRTSISRPPWSPESSAATCSTG